MRRCWISAGLVLLPSPALADHAAPGGAGSGSILVLSPDTLAKGAAAGGLRLILVRPDRRSDDQLAALAGEHVHAHDTRYTLLAGLGVSYGLTDDLTLSFELPYVRRDGLRAGSHSHGGGGAINGVEQLGSVSGIGDASVLARYRLVRGESSGVALIAGLKAPTGSTHEQSDDGERLETEHQPGTGSWDPLIGAAFGSRVGMMRINASALYQFSGKGAQQTRLGDRAVAGIALIRSFGPAQDHHEEAEPHDHADGGHEHAAPHGHASWDAFAELTGEWEGRQTIAGEIEPESGGKSLWLTPGARDTTAGGMSAAVGLGIPVWQRIRASHPDNSYRLTLSLGRAF